jgi:hypothetical protein
MKRKINIVLYYLINKNEITENLYNKIEMDINTNYTSEERTNILSGLDQATKSSNLTVEMPGINFSIEEIKDFLIKLNERFKHS